MAPSNYITPIKYTCKEGGMWVPWTFGPIRRSDLTNHLPTQTREFLGIEVHSLLFEQGVGPSIRWDSINQWDINYKG